MPPFLLDHWLAKYQFASPPIAYDLAASTGPKSAVGELLSLGTETSRLDDVTVSYAPAEGSSALREEIGEFLGVDPDWVVVTTGASEALSVLLCLAARPGGNVVLPSPAFPAFQAMANVWGLGAPLQHGPRRQLSAVRCRCARGGGQGHCAGSGKHAAQSDGRDHIT
jgi:hypothetical protein